MNFNEIKMSNNRVDKSGQITHVVKMLIISKDATFKSVVHLEKIGGLVLFAQTKKYFLIDSCTDMYKIRDFCF